MFIGCFRIRTDSVEGRIRADSDGFRAAPQGDFLACFAVCMGILTLSNWIPDSDGFGTRSDSDGFLDPNYGGHQPTPHCLHIEYSHTLAASSVLSL